MEQGFTYSTLINEVSSSAVTVILNSTDLAQVVKDKDVQGFLFSLGLFQFKDILDIENLLLGIHQSGFKLKNDDALYSILLSDLLNDQIKRMMVKSTAVSKDLDGLLKIYKSSKFLIKGKTQEGVSELLKVRKSRISEWKNKTKVVPCYVSASIDHLFDIPVWSNAVTGDKN